MVIYKELSSKISRRKLTLACLTLGSLAIADKLILPFRYPFGAGDESNEVPSDPFKVSWLCRPKNKSQICQSVDEFWSQFSDPIAYQLNNFFRNQGWLIQDSSELTSNGRSAVLTKHYKSEYYFDLYHKLWNQLSKGSELEVSHMTHRKINKHLF